VHRLILVGAVFLSASVLGCGGGPALVPVEGVITLDGGPLPNATIALLPLTAAASGPFSAVTDATGKYALGTTEAPASGAVPAEYYVNITTVTSTGGGIESAPAPTQKEVVPIAYRNSTTKFTVPPEGATAANFDMKSR